MKPNSLFGFGSIKEGHSENKFDLNLPIVFPPSVECPSAPHGRARSEDFVVVKPISLFGFGLIKEGHSENKFVFHLPIVFPPSVESPSAPHTAPVPVVKTL